MATSSTIEEREDGAAAVEDDFRNLPTDALMEILLRVPQGNRWRLRLVCRRWRDVIRDRIPAPAPATALAFVVNSSASGRSRQVWSSVHVVDDDLAEEGRCRELWRSAVVPPAWRSNPYWGHPEFAEGAQPAMVGTRNGLLCLCDDSKPGGAITLVNPFFRRRGGGGESETVAVPPLPGYAQWVRPPSIIRGWHEAYSFAYDPLTERYWVLHLPCYLDRSGGFTVLQLFTLTPGKGKKGSGSRRWRDVAVAGGGNSCRAGAGIVSIGGATHWVTMDGTERVVAFDLAGERVASTTALPPLALRAGGGGGDQRCRIAEVHGRLGVVSPGAGGWAAPEKVEVWVLGGGDDGRDRQQVWSRRYSVQVVGGGVEQRLACPDFAHGGHVLTMDTKGGVFTHRTTGAWRCGGEVQPVRVGGEGQRLSGICSGGSIRGVFAYVQTQDPFSAYRSGLRRSQAS